jgi:hypothetical protein
MKSKKTKKSTEEQNGALLQALVIKSDCGDELKCENYLTACQKCIDAFMKWKKEQSVL